MHFCILLMAVSGFAFVLSQSFRKNLENTTDVTILQIILGSMMIVSGIATLALNVS